MCFYFPACTRMYDSAMCMNICVHNDHVVPMYHTMTHQNRFPKKIIKLFGVTVTVKCQPSSRPCGAGFQKGSSLPKSQLVWNILWSGKKEPTIYFFSRLQKWSCWLHEKWGNFKLPAHGHVTFLQWKDTALQRQKSLSTFGHVLFTRTCIVAPKICGHKQQFVKWVSGAQLKNISQNPANFHTHGYIRVEFTNILQKIWHYSNIPPSKT
jgi:hypothetical protein